MRFVSTAKPLGTLSLSVCLIMSLLASVTTAEDLFEDKNLEAVVRKYVFEKRNNDKPLEEKDVEKISTIEGKNKGIKSLKGLEKCRSLALLDLEGNEIEDIGPIKELTGIQSLNLANNQIADVGPVANLVKLQYLHLAGNKVEDLSPLAKLTAMRSLYLSNNKISDLKPLSGLTKIWSLYLDGNQLQDLTPIANLKWVSSLDVANNQLQDLKPIQNYTELKYLILNKNQLKDLAVLIDMAKKDREGDQRFAPFCNVYLSDNPLSDQAKDQLAELRKLVKKVEFE